MKTGIIVLVVIVLLALMVRRHIHLAIATRWCASARR